MKLKATSLLHELFAKRNQVREKTTYVASKYCYVDIVREMIQYYDLVNARVKERN